MRSKSGLVAGGCQIAILVNRTDRSTTRSQRRTTSVVWDG